MTEENETGITGLVVYKDYRAQLNGFMNTNSTLVFDYESKKGNKEARSHIAKMRRVKTAVEKTRTGEAKIYREALNSQADFIKTEIDKMILVHQKPLDEFENKEKIRIAAIQERINEISSRDHGTTSEDIQKEIDFVNLIDLDDGWDEFLAQAISEVTDRLKFLHDKLTIAIQYEADQAELEKFRKKEEERERVDTKAMEINTKEAENIGKDDNTFTQEFSAESNDDIKEITGVGLEYPKHHVMHPDPVDQGFDQGTEDLTITADVSIDEDGNKTISNVKKAQPKSMKQKRLEAEEDFKKLGVPIAMCSILVSRISFGKVRNIKFDL